jgi:hypothetical protein
MKKRLAMAFGAVMSLVALIDPTPATAECPDGYWWCDNDYATYCYYEDAGSGQCREICWRYGSCDPDPE